MPKKSKIKVETVIPVFKSNKDMKEKVKHVKKNN